MQWVLALKIVGIYENIIEIERILKIMYEKINKAQKFGRHSEFSGLKNCQQTVQQMAVRFQHKHRRF